MDVRDLIAAGYRLAGPAAASRALGMGGRVPSDRKMRKALERHQPTPHDEEAASLDLQLVEAHTKQAARSAGRRVDEAVMRIPDDAWREIVKAAVPAWCHQFVTDYPQLHIGPDRLMALVVVGRLSMDRYARDTALRSVRGRVEKAQAGDISPYALGPVERAFNVYGSAAADVTFAETVLGDDHPQVHRARQTIDPEMVELEDLVETLRPYLEDAGIPHEEVIGPR